MKGKTYSIELTAGEFDALGWIADRYCAAEVLYDCASWEMRDVNGEEIHHGTLSSGAMWGYIAACHALEDYDFPPPPYSPCTGGTLAEKLTALVASFPTDMEFRGIER